MKKSNNKEQEKERYEISDAIMIMETTLNAAKEQKVALEEYCVKVAKVMDQLKTERARQDLAEITQINYKKMLELDINIGTQEVELRLMKMQALLEK